MSKVSVLSNVSVPVMSKVSVPSIRKSGGNLIGWCRWQVEMTFLEWLFKDD
jgi:hypothetical protein